MSPATLSLISDIIIALFTAAGVIMSIIGVVWGVIKWVLMEEIKRTNNQVLAKIDTLEKVANEQMKTLSKGGTEYSHSLRRDVDEIKDELAREFYRKSEADEDLKEIKQRLEKLELKLDRVLANTNITR